MKFNKDHPKLTAFALGELDGEEMRTIERIVADRPDLLAEVERIRRAGIQLSTEFGLEEQPRLSAQRRQEILAAMDQDEDHASKAWMWWAGLVPLAACVLAFFLTMRGSETRTLDTGMEDYVALEQAPPSPVQLGQGRAPEADIATKEAAVASRVAKKSSRTAAPAAEAVSAAEGVALLSTDAASDADTPLSVSVRYRRGERFLSEAHKVSILRCAHDFRVDGDVAMRVRLSSDGSASAVFAKDSKIPKSLRSCLDRVVSRWTLDANSPRSFEVVFYSVEN